MTGEGRKAPFEQPQDETITRRVQVNELLLLILIPLSVNLVAYAAFRWLLSDNFDEETRTQPKPLLVTLFDAPVWNRFRRWGQSQPLRLTYRRDRRGRFKKTR